MLEKSTISLVLEGDGLMKKRSCTALPIVTFLPLCLALLGVSPMFAPCVLLVYLSHFTLQASCLQRLSLPVLGSVPSLSGLWHVLTRCAQVCF